MICNYNEETSFSFGSETLYHREILKMFGERAVPVEDTIHVSSCMTALRRLSFELKDYEMFAYKSSVQEQDGRGYVYVLKI